MVKEEEETLATNEDIGSFVGSIQVVHAWRMAGFPSPTPIQAMVWPLAAKGEDCIAVANTGSGKTLAFVLPIVSHVLHRKVPSSVLRPTPLISSYTYKVDPAISPNNTPTGRPHNLLVVRCSSWRQANSSLRQQQVACVWRKICEALA